MTIVEIAKELNDTYKTEKEKTLEKKIQKLDNIVADLTKRIEYLERIIAKNARI